MKVIAINGSARKDGNTAILIKTVFEELEKENISCEMIQLGGKPVRSCMVCGKCFENKDNQCANKTDKFNDIFSKMLKADAIILGSPTYFAAISADLKALIERAGYVAIANNNAFAGKIGAAVVAVRRGGATHAFDTINHMFQMSRMVIPGSTYWNMGFGLDKGEVLEDKEGLANMRHLGKCINWLGNAIKPSIVDYPTVTQ